MAELFRIVLHIPCLPDFDLSANRRRNRHYMAQAKDTATERDRAQVELYEAERVMGSAYFPRGQSCPHPYAPVALHWTLYWPKGTRARDADNLAAMLKAWQNAMVDLGWIVNDSPRYIPTVSYTSVPSSPNGPSMELVIESVRTQEE